MRRPGLPTQGAPGSLCTLLDNPLDPFKTQYNPLNVLRGPPDFGLRDLCLSESYHPRAELAVWNAFPWAEHTIMSMSVEKPSAALVALLKHHGLEQAGDALFLNRNRARPGPRGAVARPSPRVPPPRVNRASAARLCRALLCGDAPRG